MGDKVRVERHGNRIHLKTDYTADTWAFQRNLDDIKSIPGSSWAAGSKVWTFPLDIGVCRRFRAVFGDRLDIGPALFDWGKAELGRERALRSTLDLDPTQPVELENVPHLAPTLWKAMQNRGYQSVAAKFGAIAGPHLNADEQGLGKCIETFGALIEAGVFGRVLVIAPRTAVLSTWVPEIQRWLDDFEGDVLATAATVKETRDGHVVTASHSDREATIAEYLEDSGNYSYAFLLVNAEMLNTRRVIECPKLGPRCGKESCPAKKNHKVQYEHTYPALHEVEWDAIIGDETHKYLLRATGKRPSQVGLGFMRLKTKPYNNGEGMRAALTGTPQKGRPLNLFGTLAWLRPGTYTSKWRWGTDYLATKPNRYSQSGVEILDKVRPDRRAALDRELDRIMIRRTSNELYKINKAWAPPPITFIEKWVNLDPKQQKQYEAMVADGAVNLGRRTLTANNVLSELTRLRQFCGCTGTLDGNGDLRPTLPSGKFDWLVDEFLPGLGITGDKATEVGDAKVIVSSQFTKQINLWATELTNMGIPNLRLTGEVPDAERERAAARFQRPGGPRVFLLNTNAGGVSITLDAADYVVVMDETWVPDETEQVIKRAHRTSRTDHYVKVYIVRARNTIEEAIGATNEAKSERNWQMLDARRGIEWARENWGVKA